MTTPLQRLQARKSEFKKKQESFNRPKPNWFKVAPGKSVRIQFLQELDKASPGYNGSYGTSPVDPDYDIGLFYHAVERQAHGEKGFLSRALDTMESEGRDFAQEMLEKNPHEKGWRRQENFYISVAVDRGDDKPVVEILSKNAHNEFVDEIVDFFYEDPDNQRLTGRTFIIKKGGQKNSPLTIREDTKTDMDVSGLVPYDLARDAVRRVSYDDQREYYMKNYTPEAPEDDTFGVRDSKEKAVFASSNTNDNDEDDWS